MIYNTSIILDLESGNRSFSIFYHYHQLTTSPQHFDTPNGYGNKNKSVHYFPCHHYHKLNDAYVENFHNRLVDQMFNYSRHVPILRVWNVSSIAVDQHIYWQHRIDKEVFYDCTHFCENSWVYYYWREILYNIFPLVIHQRVKLQENRVVNQLILQKKD